jgi:hypothetical protein
MRTLLLCLCILIVMSAVGLGQEKVDVVYLKNGDIRKGTIIENVPNEYVKVETGDGSIFTIKYADIQKMTKEAKSTLATQKPSVQEPPTGLMARTHDFGITGGLWLGGEISLGDLGARPEKKAGLILRVFYDEYVIEKLAVGAYANFSPITSEASTTGATMIEFGGSIKPRFPLGDGGAVLKIGLNIGYRMYSSDIPEMDKIDAMGLNLTIEVQFKTASKIAPFIEAGFLSQPVGGNKISDVTFAPIIYFGGGVAF